MHAQEPGMNWTENAQDLLIGPAAGGVPEVLAVLLHDRVVARQTARGVAARWAAGVPSTAFLIPACCDYGEFRAVPDAAVLDAEARRLMPLIVQYLYAYHLDARRLVLIGCGLGGTLALYLGLRRGLAQAGLLAFAAGLTDALCPTGRTTGKVRIIACADTREPALSRLGPFMDQLNRRGINVRGVAMDRRSERQAMLRLGGAYLAELVATAHHDADTRWAAYSSR
jgi:hypothetical protein